MSAHDAENGDAVELTPLTVTPGSAEDRDETKRNIEKYRKLAIASVVCGLSCIGYKALESVYKAEYRPQEAQTHLKEAKKCSIISILALFAVLISIPLLIVFISYVLTLFD